MRLRTKLQAIMTRSLYMYRIAEKMTSNDDGLSKEYKARVSPQRFG